MKKLNDDAIIALVAALITLALCIAILWGFTFVVVLITKALLGWLSPLWVSIVWTVAVAAFIGYVKATV